MRLRIRVAPALAALLALSAVAVAVEKPSADAIIAALKKGFAGVNDYSAQVTVTVKGPQVSINGMQMKLYFKKPSKWHIDAEQGVAMFPQGNFFGNPAEELATGAQATYVKSENRLGTDCHVLKISRPNAGPGAPALTLWVDKKHTVIVAAESATESAMKTSWRYAMIDGKYYLPTEICADLRPPGGANANKPVKATIRFSNYKVNKGIDDKIFQSKPQTADNGPHLRRRYRN